jgi:hypothetical protein
MERRKSKTQAYCLCRSFPAEGDIELVPGLGFEKHRVMEPLLLVSVANLLFTRTRADRGADHEVLKTHAVEDDLIRCRLSITIISTHIILRQLALQVERSESIGCIEETISYS